MVQDWSTLKKGDKLYLMIPVDGKVSGKWTFCKRGQNYGVKFLG